MMTLYLLLFIGVAVLIAVPLLANRYYKLPVVKVLIITALLVVMSYFSAKLMFFLENGYWEGDSFFGAVLLSPLLALIAASIVRAPVSAVMDLYALTGSVMLALMKVKCLYSGCCNGRIIAYAVNGDAIRFPSQIVEGAVALWLSLFMFWLMDRRKYQGKLLPWVIILYSASRFVLNLLRDTVPVLWGMAVGNIWAVVAIILGVVLLVVMSRKTK